MYRLRSIVIDLSMPKAREKFEQEKTKEESQESKMGMQTSNRRHGEENVEKKVKKQNGQQIKQGITK